MKQKLLINVTLTKKFKKTRLEIKQELENFSPESSYQVSVISGKISVTFEKKGNFFLFFFPKLERLYQKSKDFEIDLLLFD